jgi:hypothetical protein
VRKALGSPSLSGSRIQHLPQVRAREGSKPPGVRESLSRPEVSPGGALRAAENPPASWQASATVAEVLSGKAPLLREGGTSRGHRAEVVGVLGSGSERVIGQVSLAPTYPCSPCA